MISFLGVRLEAMICAGFMSYQTRRVRGRVLFSIIS